MPDVINKVKVEIKKLLKVKFVRTSKYVTWLSNIVPIIKNNNKLSICINFKKLNNSTPKGKYPIPVANMLIDSAMENVILSFMNEHSGNNKIFIVEENISKITFRYLDSLGMYRWVVMPFRLKNARAIYQ